MLWCISAKHCRLLRMGNQICNWKGSQKKLGLEISDWHMLAILLPTCVGIEFFVDLVADHPT